MSVGILINNLAAPIDTYPSKNLDSHLISQNLIDPPFEVFPEFLDPFPKLEERLTPILI